MTLREKLEMAGAAIVFLLAWIGGPPAFRRFTRWVAGALEKRRLARERRDAALLGAEREVKLAQIHAAQNDAEREDRTIDRLWDRLDATDARLDECESKHRKSEAQYEECERERERDRAKVTDLESHVLELQGIALRSDDTGQFRTELAAWGRSSPPPKPLNLPPPKRRGE